MRVRDLRDDLGSPGETSKAYLRLGERRFLGECSQGKASACVQVLGIRGTWENPVMSVPEAHQLCRRFTSKKLKWVDAWFKGFKRLLCRSLGLTTLPTFKCLED